MHTQTNSHISDIYIYIYIYIYIIYIYYNAYTEK